MNKVILIGNLCQDSTVILTSGGVKVLNNTVAVKRDIKNSQGNYETDFINFVAFKMTAELIETYFKKGDRIGLIGRWQHRSYQDKNNQTKYVDELVVENIEFLQQREQQQQQTPPPAPQSFNVDDDKDLPF